MTVRHRPSGLLYTLLGWLVSAYAVGHFIFYVLPRTAWRHYTGKITPADERHWTDANKEGKF
jgi:hypothetical protein